MFFKFNPETLEVTEVGSKEWAKAFEGNPYNRVLRNDTIKVDDEDVFISTVFLGIDHSFGSGGPPLIFETMIFGGKYNDYQERYPTVETAIAGHDAAIQMVINNV